MLLERLIYFLREAGRNYRTNPVVSGVSTGIISLSILIFGLFLVTFFNFQGVFDRWGRKVRIDAYLVDSISVEQRVGLESKISNHRAVEKVVYISADDALAQFRGMLGGQQALLDELETNPLPASFQLFPKKGSRSPAEVRALAEEIGRMEGVAQVRYGAEWVEKFAAVIRVLQILGVIIGGILLLSSLLIISNTIRLTIYARREEIEIMRLVGANESFIRIPFFLEGLFQGFVAGAVALGLLWGIYWAVLERMELPLSTLGPVRFSFLPMSACLGLIAGGTLIGMLGSSFALSHLKESADQGT